MYDSMSMYARTFVDKSVIEKLVELKELADKFNTNVEGEQENNKVEETNETNQTSNNENQTGESTNNSTGE
ncbi:hypothetical protein [Lachnobacterium bovis]|nr:hypothetical protein [Lachnobacterium bovis]